MKQLKDNDTKPKIHDAKYDSNGKGCCYRFDDKKLRFK